MTVWLTNIGAGLIVFALTYASTKTHEIWAQRRGSLAGYWLWITYAPEDQDKRDTIWSLEVARIRQSRAKAGREISGVAWRLFDRHTPSHFSRRWEFSGQFISGVIEGRYAATRDLAGSHGGFSVWEVDPALFEGHYTRVLKTSRGGQLVHEREAAWTEWVRLPDVLSPALA